MTLNWVTSITLVFSMIGLGFALGFSMTTKTPMFKAHKDGMYWYREAYAEAMEENKQLTEENLSLEKKVEKLRKYQLLGGDVL